MRIFLLPAVLLLGSGACLAQNPDIKFGLWETRTTMQTPMGTTMNTTVRSCVTQETVASAFAPQTAGSDCKINTVPNGHGYVSDGQCTGRAGTMTVHAVLTVVDPEHATHERHMEGQLQGHPITMNSNGTAHFVSADCGSVKPGQPQIQH